MRKMHPDAQAVWSSVWSVDAPTTQSGITFVVLSAKSTKSTYDHNAEEADEIAEKLITNARLDFKGISSINGIAFRKYMGEGLTELAVRRG